MKIISLYKFNETQIKEIEQLGIYEYHSSLDTADVVDCDVIIGNPKPEILKYAKQLKWVQLYSAGNDQYTKDQFPEGCILTNASGTFGQSISEHLILYTLAMMRNAKHYTHAQDNHEWQPIRQNRMIYGSTFLIVGVGDIGSHYATSIQALGSYTIGLRRSSNTLEPGFDEMYTIDELNDLLPRADVVVLALPKHPSTNHVVSKQQFSLMKEDCLLLNVGRSNAIDTDALIQALQNNLLGGVQLDVFDEEPLPSHSPLWTFENVYITPHVSGTFANKQTRVLFENIALDNIDRYLHNKPLHNIVDFSIGYRK